MRAPALASAGLAGALAAALLVPLAPLAAHADEVTGIRINEIVTNGGVPGDWIEVTNTSDEAIDISGWIVKDDNDSRTLAVAADTTVAPGAFVVIEVDVEGGFGLGNGDSARIFLPDGTTLVDGHDFPSHGNPSWVRCPDGTGDFVPSASVTKAAANDCGDPAEMIVVNEVVSTGGVPVDWIEIMNIGAVPVDVSGWIVKDDNDSRTLAFPADTIVAPGGFATIDVDVVGGFGLGNGDAARVFLADGTTLVDAIVYPEHAATSWARCPDGVGEPEVSETVTKGAANDCLPPAGAGIRLNEIESNGGTPGDWVELTNISDETVDASNWLIKDNDDTRTTRLPGGTTVDPGAFIIIEETTLGFGLGAADSVRLYAEDGVTLIDQHSWTEHSLTTLSRCPDGTGDWQVSTSSTKAAANDCGLPVRINEIVSEGTDFIELINVGASPVDISGFVLRDNNDTSSAVIPADTVLASGEYFVAEEPLLTFGLGNGDAARLFEADGTTLVDGYTYPEHAGTSWSRCPDGTGDFARSQAVTKGAENLCEGDVVVEAWPGSPDVTTLDGLGTFGGDMSGLAWDAGALWAVNNGTGGLFRFVQNSGEWMRDAAWTDGRTLRYPDGTGTVDAEGLGVTAAGASAGIYVASERNNDASSVSRPSVLRYVPGGSGDLAATHEWNLAGLLPAVGANAGLEGIAWVPDAHLVAQGFVDASTGELYDPSGYAAHAGGVFFVALEGTGGVYGVVLEHTTGAATLVATVDAPLPLVADLVYDPSTLTLWAACDQACEGRVALLTVQQSGETDGAWAVSRVVSRPAGMANIANEGVAFAGAETCAAGSKAVFWADDSETGGVSIRTGAVDCVALPVAVDDAELTDDARGSVAGPGSADPGTIIEVSLGVSGAGLEVNGWLHSTPQWLGTATADETGAVRLLLPADIDGEHRIVITDANGVLLGWDDLVLGDVAIDDNDDGELAFTGVQTAGIIGLSAMLLAGGLVLVALRRRATI